MIEARSLIKSVVVEAARKDDADILPKLLAAVDEALERIAATLEEKRA